MVLVPEEGSVHKFIPPSFFTFYRETRTEMEVKMREQTSEVCKPPCSKALISSCLTLSLSPPLTLYIDSHSSNPSSLFPLTATSTFCYVSAR